MKNHMYVTDYRLMSDSLLEYSRQRKHCTQSHALSGLA